MNQHQIHASCPFSKKNRNFSQQAELEYMLDEYSLWLGTVLEALSRQSGARELHKSMN